MCRKSVVVLLIGLSFVVQPQPGMSTNLVHKSAECGLRKLFAGVASLYADCFHGRRTASGERFDQNKLTCAHRYLPFGTRLLVENPENGNVVVVTVNDRGPYHGNRVIDLSRAAAHRLGIKGIGQVICYTGKGVERASVDSMQKSNQLRSALGAVNAGETIEDTVSVVRRSASISDNNDPRDRVQIAATTDQAVNELVNSDQIAMDETY